MDATGRHSSTQQAVRGFTYDHLPHRLQAVSRPFSELAEQMLSYLPDDPELTAALRKLREAKDCCVLLAALADTAAES
ncbi:hypothetical protein AB0A77_28255 [Streptomyces varsoviensis]|uniref:hypothetical protein n=1 Tax=Streptomyces varsoviensis TaxID=67373 RepID=UPI0033DCB17C